MEPTDRLIVHAAPDVIAVEGDDDARRLIARGRNLDRTLESPMCLLRREGEGITREDLWPTDADAGTSVLLPGGEVGILQGWWNAEDRKECGAGRWSSITRGGRRLGYRLQILFR